LRIRMQETAKKMDWDLYIPSLAYCTDNAAMIAMAAHFHFLNKKFNDQSVVPFARANS